MKVLFLTHRLPYAPNRGDRIRSYHMLRTLARESEVHLFSLSDVEDIRHAKGLESWLASITTAVPPRRRNQLRGVFTLPGTRPLTHTLLDAPGVERTLETLAQRVQPDVVFAYCSGMARFCVGGPLQNLPWVLDMVDVDSAKWRSLSETTAAPLRWVYAREGRVLRAFEAVATRRATHTIVVNARERDTLADIAPEAPITVLENGVDLSYFAPASGPAASHDVVFCGVMDYQPNIEGVQWFLRNIWDGVRRNVPEARFIIVGARPASEVRALTQTSGVHVTGAVEDVRPFLWNAAVSVAPLLTARGLQNKVLEALAAGLPVVATHAVGSGLPGEALPGCDITDDLHTFAKHVIRHLEATPSERRARSALAHLDALAWENRLAGLSTILRAAARRV